MTLPNMTSPKLLYVLFQVPGGDSDEARTAALKRAHHIAQWPGLIRKTWIYDSTTQEYGGIYLFQDAASVQAYLDGPVIANLKAIPGVNNFHTRIFDVNPDLSDITRGFSQPESV